MYVEVLKMTNKIKCGVCSCVYNKDHLCEAAEIEVKNCHCHGQDAKQCDQTECGTFKMR